MVLYTVFKYSIKNMLNVSQSQCFEKYVKNSFLPEFTLSCDFSNNGMIF